MSQHTALPWSAHMINTATVNIRAGEISVAAVYRHIGNPVLHDRAGEGDNNAAFIVRACNSHAALVEALKECLECEFHVTGKSTIAKAEAALALAHTAQGDV